MSNLSTAAVVANEIAKAVDFNYANDQSINNISVALQAILAGGSSDYVIGGNVLPYPSGGMNFIINPIYGHCRTSGVDVVETLQSQQPISVETASATLDRYDTIQVRGIEKETDFQNRKFKDPETGAVTTISIATKKLITLDVMVKKGADGSVTAPLADNGYVKLAEIFIPAGTVSLISDNIRNITARASGQENSAWTIDKTRTFNPGYLAEVIEKFLTAHNEDGTHKDNVINAADINFGTDTETVNSSVIPIGASMAIRGTNYTSQISMATIITALATAVNAAYPYANNLLNRYVYTPDLPVAASTANVDVTAGGEMVIDGVTCTVGQMVLLKDQANPKQNGFWEVQTGAWNRYPGYTSANEGCFTYKFVLVETGIANAGKVFYLEHDTYTLDGENASNLNFKESIFSPQDLPGKASIRDKNGRTIDDEKREAAIAGFKLDMARHADQIDGMGRNLLDVLGVDSIPAAMAEIRRRCNNNGEIDDTGIPDFRGLEIGDYIDGINLDGLAVAPGGNAPQAWNDTYKNNRIVVSGFNYLKNAGDAENVKNHILFTFRNIICQGRMNPTNTNAGGYMASEMRIWLDGANGDGSGTLATKIKSAIGGNYLYTVRRLLSTKGTDSWAWANYTVFLLSEHEVFGSPHWSESGYGDGLAVQCPIFQKSTVYRVKRFNGSRHWWWLSSPLAANATHFCGVYYSGYAYHTYGASEVSGGVAPAFCVA